MSVYVVHEISDRIVSNLDRSDLRHTFSHYMVLRDRNEDSYFDIRRRWRRGELPDVISMMPVLEGSIDVEGTLVPVLGFDLLANLSDSEIISPSRQSFDELFTNDTLMAFGNAQSLGSTIRGVRIAYTRPSSRNFLLADIPTAQNLLNRPHHLDSVWLRTDSNASRAWYSRLIPGIETALKLDFDPPELDGFVVNSMNTLNPSRHFSLSIAFNIGQLGLLAMFVAAFIFHQAVHLNLDRRNREFERLHTIGVSEHQITLVVCAEAVVLAIVASVVGLALGMAFLFLMVETDMSEPWDSLTWWSVGKSCGLALLVAAVGSYYARKPKAQRTTMQLRLVGSFVCVVAVLFGFSAHSGLLGAFLLMVALCILTTLVSVPLIIWLISKTQSLLEFGSSSFRMTVRGAFDTIKSIRTIVAAFSIAIAMPMGIGLLVDSYRTEFDSLLDERLTPGLYLSNAAQVEIESIRRIPGVDEVREYHRGTVLLPSGAFDVTLARLDQWELHRYDAPLTAANGVLINEFAHRNRGLRIGDTIDIRFDSGEILPSRVSHVFRDFGATSPRLIVPRTNIPTGLVRDRLTVLGTTEALPDVEREVRERYPEIDLNRTDEIRLFAIRIFEQTFALTLAMSNLSLIVAILGLTSSLFVLSSQQDVTFRLLHGVGVPQSKLVLSTSAQCLILGVVAVICAIPLSIGIAWALCELVNPRAFSSAIHLQFSIERFVLPGSLGLIAAVIAGLAPCRESLKRVIGQPQIDVA